MANYVDPRREQTRRVSLDAALEILQEQGILAVTHASIGFKTGISRSTLYRHWPKIGDLHNDAIKVAASPPAMASKTNGPLRADLLWIIGILMDALNDTTWGRVAPQVVSLASTDDEVGGVLNCFMEDRLQYVQSVFDAAAARGELPPGAPVKQLREMAIAVPYFRKFIARLPLDQSWLEHHVDTLCCFAMAGPTDMSTG